MKWHFVLMGLIPGDSWLLCQCTKSSSHTCDTFFWCCFGAVLVLEKSIIMGLEPQ